MDNSIYKVERDEYVGFIGQLNKSMMDVEQEYAADLTIMKIRSKATDEVLCTRMIANDGEEHYFIFKMPLDEERIAPKPVMKVTLNTKEEVQALFDAINKLELEAHKNDRTLQ